MNQIGIHVGSGKRAQIIGKEAGIPSTYTEAIMGCWEDKPKLRWDIEKVKSCFVDLSKQIYNKPELGNQVIQIGSIDDVKLLIKLGMHILYKKQNWSITRNVCRHTLKYDADNPIIAFNLGFIESGLFANWDAAEPPYKRLANNGYFFAVYFLYRRYTLEKYDHEKLVK